MDYKQISITGLVHLWYNIELLYIVTGTMIIYDLIPSIWELSYLV